MSGSEDGTDDLEPGGSINTVDSTTEGDDDLASPLMPPSHLGGGSTTSSLQPPQHHEISQSSPEGQPVVKPHPYSTASLLAPRPTVPPHSLGLLPPPGMASSSQVAHTHTPHLSSPLPPHVIAAT